MECKNCYCSINHGRFCSNACRMAKFKEDVRLSLTKNINALLEAKDLEEADLKEAEHESKCFHDEMASYLKVCAEDEVYEISAKYKKEIERCRLQLKITKFSIIIGISLRDKKGTYPQLKPKYNETLDEHMASIDTSEELCKFADDAKKQYELYEFMYSVLK